MKRREPIKPLNILYCYAPDDEELLKKLEQHLSVLKRLGQITTWYDRDILPGMERTREFDIHLNRANIILLLISPDFMHSDSCYNVQMGGALKKQKAGEAHVIPI